MGTVTWAIVASEFSGIGDWYTSKMGANSQNYEPFFIFAPFAVMLGMPEGSNIDRLFGGDFFCRPEKKGIKYVFLSKLAKKRKITYV